MARRFFRRFTPDRARIDSDRWLRWARPVLNRPYLWHLNRHSVAVGTAWGMFWALIPLPMQSPFAVLCAIWCRGNVPLSYAATWLSNPFTLIPHWWTAYTIGKFVLRSDGVEGIEFTWEFWQPKVESFSAMWGFMVGNLWNFYLPLLVGSVVLATFVALLGYIAVDRFWMFHARGKWRQSRLRALRAVSGPGPASVSAAGSEPPQPPTSA